MSIRLIVFILWDRVRSRELVSVLSALQYWKHLTQMLFNLAPCSARERLSWSWVCQLLVQWDIQVDQFFFLSRSHCTFKIGLCAYRS